MLKIIITLKYLAVALMAGLALANAAQAKADVMEDDPSWDCTTMGNSICGPDNAQGAPAGLYDTGGVLVTPWATLCQAPTNYLVFAGGEVFSC